MDTPQQPSGKQKTKNRNATKKANKRVDQAEREAASLRTVHASPLSAFFEVKHGLDAQLPLPNAFMSSTIQKLPVVSALESAAAPDAVAEDIQALLVHVNAVLGMEDISWEKVSLDDIILLRLGLGSQAWGYFNEAFIRKIYDEMRASSYLISDKQDPLANRFVMVMGLDPFITVDRAHPNARFHLLRILVLRSQGVTLCTLDKYFIQAYMEHNYYISDNDAAQYRFYCELCQCGGPSKALVRLTSTQKGHLKALEGAMAWAWKNGDYKAHVDDLARLKRGLDFILPDINRLTGEVIDESAPQAYKPVSITRTEGTHAAITDVPFASDGVVKKVLDHFFNFVPGQGKLMINTKGLVELIQGVAGDMDACRVPKVPNSKANVVLRDRALNVRESSAVTENAMTIVEGVMNETPFDFDPIRQLREEAGASEECDDEDVKGMYAMPLALPPMPERKPAISSSEEQQSLLFQPHSFQLTIRTK